jgi:hypothetical protein
MSKSMWKEHATSGRCCLATGGHWRSDRLIQTGDVDAAHPGPPYPRTAYFFPLTFSLTADMYIQLPQQDTRYVVRDLYCLLVFSSPSACFTSPSPSFALHPVLLLLSHPCDQACDLAHNNWEASACALDKFCPVRTSSIISFSSSSRPSAPPRRFTFLHYAQAQHKNKNWAPFMCLSCRPCPTNVFSNHPSSLLTHQSFFSSPLLQPSPPCLLPLPHLRQARRLPNPMRIAPA